MADGVLRRGRSVHPCARGLPGGLLDYNNWFVALGAMPCKKLVIYILSDLNAIRHVRSSR